MVPKRATKKWVLLSAAVVGLVAIMVLVNAARQRPYGFTFDFGGRERSLVAVGLRDDRTRYSFTGPWNQVLTAMKRDLLADRWTIVYEDAEVTAFKRQGRDGEEWAELAKVKYPNGPDLGTSCVAAIPRHETWIQTAVGAAMDRLGWRSKPTSIQAFVCGGDLTFETRRNDVDGTLVCDLIWRNRTREAITAMVKDVFWHDYESREAPPFTQKLDAWQTATTRLTFPRDAAEGGDKGALSGSYSFYGSWMSGSGAISARWAGPVLHIGGPTGDRRVVVLENPLPAAMEVSRLTVKMNGTVVLRKESALILPGKKARLPFVRPSPTRHRSFTVINGLWRSGSNKRWVPFGMAG